MCVNKKGSHVSCANPLCGLVNSQIETKNAIGFVVRLFALQYNNSVEHKRPERCRTRPVPMGMLSLSTPLSRSDRSLFLLVHCDVERKKITILNCTHLFNQRIQCLQKETGWVDLHHQGARGAKDGIDQAGPVRCDNDILGGKEFGLLLQRHVVKQTNLGRRVVGVARLEELHNLLEVANATAFGRCSAPMRKGKPFPLVWAIASSNTKNRRRAHQSSTRTQNERRNQDDDASFASMVSSIVAITRV